MGSSNAALACITPFMEFPSNKLNSELLGQQDGTAQHDTEKDLGDDTEDLARAGELCLISVGNFGPDEGLISYPGSKGPSVECDITIEQRVGLVD